MNKYSHLAVFLTSLSSFCWLTVALANEQVSLDSASKAYASSPIENISYTSEIQPVSSDSELSATLEQDAHQELNAIANESLVTAVLEGKLKPEIKPEPKLPQVSPSDVSNGAIALVKEFEGFRAAAYLDTDGTPVIGYGQSRVEGRRVRLGDYISYPAADTSLRTELKTIQQEILSVVKVELNSNQLGAISSLAFNTGFHAIKKSTLVRKLNQKDYEGAADEFLRWDKANIGGRLVKMPGLSRRRGRERQLFLTPVTPAVASTQEY